MRTAVFRPTFLTLVALSLCAVGRGADAPAPLPRATPDLGRLPAKAKAQYDFVMPRADERRWEQISWLLDLSEGVRQARAEKRPLLIWVSNEDPLERC
jgi:hypothetical protein